MSDGFKSPESEHAERGTRLHAAVVPGGSREGLTPEDLELVADCEAWIADILESYPGADVYHELPLVLRDGFAILSEGTADVAIHVPRLELVILADWKFGRKRVTAAGDNLQVKTYGIMALQKFKAEIVQVHVVQPTIKSASFASFTSSEAPGHIERVRDIIHKCHRATLHLLTGEHCVYCPRFTTCGAARREALQSVSSPEVAAAVTDLDRLASLLRAAKFAMAWAEAVERQAKAVGVENEGLPGFHLKTRAGNRTIKESEKAFELLSGYFSPAEFLASCKVQVGGLEAAYIAKRLAGMTTGKITRKELAAEFAAMVAPVLAREADVRFLEAIG